MRWLKNLMSRSPRSRSSAPAAGEEAHHAPSSASEARQGWDSELLRVARGTAPSHTERVRELLALGATISCQDSDEETPLMKAAWAGNVETLKLLVAAGAELEPRNWEGKTPLMAAAIYGHLPALSYLLEAGASPYVRCERGETARSYASLTGNHEIVDRLITVQTQNVQLLDPPLIDAKCSNCGGSFSHYADGAPVHSADGRSAVGQTYLCVGCGKMAKFRDEPP